MNFQVGFTCFRGGGLGGGGVGLRGLGLWGCVPVIGCRVPKPKPQASHTLNSGPLKSANLNRVVCTQVARDREACGTVSCGIRGPKPVVLRVGFRGLGF